MDVSSLDYGEYMMPEAPARQEEWPDDPSKVATLETDFDFDPLAASQPLGLDLHPSAIVAPPQNPGSAPEFEELPPFTIELEMYFDPMAIDEFPESQNGVTLNTFHQRQTQFQTLPNQLGQNQGLNNDPSALLYFPGEQHLIKLEFAGIKTGTNTSHNSLNTFSGGLQNNVTPQQDNLDGFASPYMGQMDQDMLPQGGISANDIDMRANMPTSEAFSTKHINNPNNNNFFQVTTPYDTQSIHSAIHQQPSTMTFSVDPSVMAHPSEHGNLGLNELLPLTTVNSHTPSVLLMHLTQHLFFLAHQYHHRNLLEVPPLINRLLFDHYSNSRVLLDLVHSLEPQRRHTLFANSILNYFPFMGQRNYLGPSSPSHLPPFVQNGQVQPLDISPRNRQRHLIRGIFKNKEPEKMGIVAESALLDLLFAEEEEDDDVKKPPKKPKRSLFNRFKSQEDSNLAAMVPGGSINSQISVANLSANSASNGQLPGLNGSDGADESSVPSATLDTASSNTSFLQVAQEPDYAALFEGVGKRNLVSTLKSKPKVKEEAQIGESSIGERDSIEDPVSTGGTALRIISNSILKRKGLETLGIEKNSNQIKSTISNSEIDTQKLNPQELSSLQNSSNRTSFEQMENVEVESKFSDILPDTQGVSSVSRKNKTRGRKENKAADMLDLSKIFLCTYCLRRFKRQEHLKRHFRLLHTFDKPYECKICHKKFSRSDNLNQHYKIHRNGDEEDENEEMGSIEETMACN